MEILKSTPNLNPAVTYALIKSPEVQPMRMIEGAQLKIKEFAIYSDINQRGEIQTVSAIRDVEGNAYATNSPTFCKDFMTIVDIFGCEDLPEIRIKGMTSRNNRHFITCAAVVE